MFGMSCPPSSPPTALVYFAKTMSYCLPRGSALSAALRCKHGACARVCPWLPVPIQFICVLDLFLLGVGSVPILFKFCGWAKSMCFTLFPVWEQLPKFLPSHNLGWCLPSIKLNHGTVIPIHGKFLKLL